MAITLSDIFIPKGSWRVSRGFTAHGKYGIPGIDYAMANDSLLVNCFYGDAIVDAVGTNPKGKDWGEYIWLKSLKDPRYKAAYAHCRKFVVKKGQRVKSGQLIGYSDNSGNSTGPHLHFSITFNGKPTDPEKLSWKVRNIKKPYTPSKPKPKETTMFKDKSGIFKVTLSAASWNASAVRYYKDFKNTLSKLNKLKFTIKSNYVTKVSYEKSLQYAQDQYDSISEKRLVNHNIETDLLEEEITAMGVDILTLKNKLQDCEKASKEPKGPKIPRVSKNDGWWGKLWKKILQVVAK